MFATIKGGIRFWMARAEAGNDCLHHTHRVRLVLQLFGSICFYKVFKLVVHLIVDSNLGLKGLELHS